MVKLVENYYHSMVLYDCNCFLLLLVISAYGLSNTNKWQGECG